ncbi:hypothetical protein CAK95_05600 [Pseudorhodoplanes sinuspersici]|uniref:NACHT domain-containing protein n=1 Tax=Pseudorhodoplanes sinuspersici TaxID=1235591 RepID=A0A1W6ZMH2_9HYPH|nr:hypothetical protein CAK95_05600 [Pseudorhodoplanes sinuspersici]
MHARQIDAYAELDEKQSVAIEVTEQKSINKLQEDLNKLIHIRNVNFNSGFIQTICICVTAYEPTLAMQAAGKKINIDVLSIEQFRTRFLPFDEYNEARKVTPFGSAIDPETGSKDNTKYVLVSFNRQKGGEIDTAELSELVAGGRIIVMTGEYGTGKSKCVEQVYNTLAMSAWENLEFPVAIDLRKCWGLKDRYEIIRRHLQDLNLSQHVDAFLKAYNNGMLILLLDGFDELGVQLWSDDSSALKALRADALSGVRDLITHQRIGILVCGRDHYFDSNDELFAALGLANSSAELLRSKDEFTFEEIAEFLKVNGRDGDIPEWLPRKPLTCEFFLRVFDEVGAELSEELDLVQFWDLLINAVCEREARIHSSFDVDTIKRILVEVASATRTKPANVGPLSLSEIQAAFERVVGHAPIEQASVLLQRLPGLGRASADSEERRFVDTYLLDGLRATDVIFIADRRDARASDAVWLNPLSENGLLICGRKLMMLNLIDDAIAHCKANTKVKNQTLLLDLVCSVLVSGVTDVDFGGQYIEYGHASVLDLAHARVAGLHVDNSVIERLIISGVEVRDVKITASNIGVLEGVSSQGAIPAWLSGNSIEVFSSIATTSRIRAANLEPTQKVLVTVLRKTFFQKGAGRKEEALLRGLGKLVKSGVLDRILGKLISEGLLRKEKGDGGNLYIPVRSETQRVGKILAELSLSKDPIWLFVAGL